MVKKKLLPQAVKLWVGMGKKDSWVGKGGDGVSAPSREKEKVKELRGGRKERWNSERGEMEEF